MPLGGKRVGVVGNGCSAYVARVESFFRCTTFVDDRYSLKGAVRAADREGSLGRGDQFLSKPAVVHTESKFCFSWDVLPFCTGAGLSFFFSLPSQFQYDYPGWARWVFAHVPFAMWFYRAFLMARVHLINVLSPRTLVDVHAFFIRELIGRSGIYAL